MPVPHQRLSRRRILGGSAVAIGAIAGCTGTDRSGGPQASEDGENVSLDEIETKEDVFNANFDLEEVREKSSGDFPPYNELVRHAEENIGMVMSDRVKVLQVQSHSEEDLYQLRLSINQDLDDIMGWWQGLRPVEDDWLDVRVIVAGLTSYETVLGDTREIPEVRIVYLEVVEDP